MVSLDSLKLRNTQDLFADDYGNIYLYKNKDFSFTKYDSLGEQKGKMMMTVPFKIQNVQNPLNTILFSENAQEVQFVDQNLNTIQRYDLTKNFGFVKEVYVEDQQMMWLLDDSAKRLVQLNFRDKRVINSIPQFWNFDEVEDILVFDGLVYVLTANEFAIRNLKGEALFRQSLTYGKRLRRENDRIYIITRDAIMMYSPSKPLETVFSKVGSKIVDKNSSTFFELMDNNLYLYSSQKPTDN